MLKGEEIRIPPKGVQSLCWDGDELVDWVAGGHRYYMDGHIEPRHVGYRFIFDAAAISPSGDYAVIYVRRGTKGLVLHRGSIIREINRSFYYADTYEYPVTLFRLENGQEVMAHCPDHYRQLEIEDLATGERLTSLDTRKPSDYFFSWLAANAEGSFLLSAGWHWQPVDHVAVFNVQEALKNPSHLDGRGLEFDTWAQNSSAAFAGNDRLVAALWDDIREDDHEEDDETEAPDHDPRQSPNRDLRVFGLKEARLLSTVHPEATPGTIMPVGEEYVIGFYEYPKLIRLLSGAVIEGWPHVRAGRQSSSIIWGIDPVPPMAFDPARSRFAVGSDSEITVIQLAVPI